MSEMKLLSYTDDSWHPPSVNEVTHDINPDTIGTIWTQLNKFPPISCEISNNLWPTSKISVLMPSNIQIHRQVPLSNVKILEETKVALYKLLQKFDTIILKSDNDIGQMDLIEMHIATRLDATPVVVWPYPFGSQTP